jgi:peptide/nickel transport system permease protein
MRRTGLSVLLVVAAASAVAPWLAPNPPDTRFIDLLLAPPTRVHLFDDGFAGPHIHRWRMVSRIERRFEEDRERPAPLRWWRGRVVSTGEAGAPLLLLGADLYGRDVLSRLLHGARVTLSLAALAAAGATLLGLLAGGLAGYAGGWIDSALSRTSEFVLVLPAIYVALALRAVMPLVLPPETTFALLAAIFIAFGWPIVARPVRAIVLVEREREYVSAARAVGASHARVLVRHLLPAAGGHAAVQATLLVPSFVVAEATLSFVGLGFPDATPTWGTMLHEAAGVALAGAAPWTLAPAAAIFLVTLGTNLAVQGGGRVPVQLER